jgi:peptide-methionine (S)-S-oxide reductase
MIDRKRTMFRLFAPALLVTVTACVPAVAQTEEAVRIPAPTLDPADTRTSATAIFGGGCFWGVEGVFEHVRGVTRVDSGYHGGTRADATYSRVSDGDTAHFEGVRITYDPRVVSYGTLLRVLFSVVMDPTTLNRQGPDAGTQYRSAIVPANASQRAVAEAYIAQLTEGRHWPRRIVTRIEAPQTFYNAEPYHQDYMRRNPTARYIVQWDAPKLANFRSLYPRLYQATPAD